MSTIEDVAEAAWSDHTVGFTWRDDAQRYGEYRMFLAGYLAASQREPSEPAPWDRPDGCFGHCDPEGWYAPCKGTKNSPQKSEPSDTDEREDLARDLKAVAGSLMFIGNVHGAQVVKRAVEYLHRQGQIAETLEDS